jgi:hypothetical protein
MGHGVYSLSFNVSTFGRYFTTMLLRADFQTRDLDGC